MRGSELERETELAPTHWRSRSPSIYGELLRSASRGLYDNPANMPALGTRRGSAGACRTLHLQREAHGCHSDARAARPVLTWCDSRSPPSARHNEVCHPGFSGKWSTFRPLLPVSAAPPTSAGAGQEGPRGLTTCQELF